MWSKKNQLLLLIIGIGSIIVSCPMDRKNIQVRAICERPLGSSLTFSVFVEGPYGTSLDACRVLVKTPSGAVSLIRYNSNRAAYEGSFQSPENGTYQVQVLTSLTSEEITLDVPFFCLSQGPAIINIQDEVGNSYTQNKPPLVTKKIYVSWQSIEGATLYRLTISKNVSTIFSWVTTETGCLIPANTLEKGTYNWVVEAQAISGDPLLREKNYYSFSSAQGASVICQVSE